MQCLSVYRCRRNVHKTADNTAKTHIYSALRIREGSKLGYAEQEALGEGEVELLEKHRELLDHQRRRGHLVLRLVHGLHA